MTHKARKRFGQHFLNDTVLINETIKRFAPQSDECIVEIGPGQGALTYPLLNACTHLHAIEIDRDLVPILQERSKKHGQLTVHQQDVLTFDFHAFAQAHTRLRLIGNLPYNISSPLLFHLFSALDDIQDMVFMLQKEVADRLYAEPGTKSNGRLSIMAQYHCQIDHWFTVPPESFDPPPKVDSAIIRLRPRQKGNDFSIIDTADLNTVLLKAFATRRKTLQNNLKGMFSAEQIIAAGIDPSTRPETLGVAAYIKLTQLYRESLS